MKVKIILSVLIGLLSVNSFAYDRSGVVQNLRPQHMAGDRNFVIVDLKTPRTGGAATACASSASMLIDLNNEAGQAMYAFLLIANQDLRPVYLRGSGVCSVVSSVETVAYVRYN